MPHLIVNCDVTRYNGDMNRVDFDKLMQKETEKLGGNKARLLIHSCCAPCSSACLERLKDYFDITVLYYNPNIEDGEYEVRKAEQIRFLKETGWAEILDCDHETEKFYQAVKGLENCPEGGARCAVCYRLRIERTAEEAERLGFDYFATTLTVSPHKDAAAINAAGEALARPGGVRWLPSDFKKRGGYQRSIQLCREHGIYRQSWCGCAYANPGAAAASSL